MLCDLCGGSGIELGIECPGCEEDAMVCLVDHSPACSKCGGHGFDPELVEAVAQALIWKDGLVLAELRSSLRSSLRKRAVKVLSVVRERLER